MRTEHERLVSVARKLAGMLARGRIDELVAYCSTSRMSADTLRRVVAEYGFRLVEPPVNAYAVLNAVAIAGAEPPSYSVRVPLWTAQEGRSDLELITTVTLLKDSESVELDDLLIP